MDGATASQVNDPAKTKTPYKRWSTEESNELLRLLVDAVKRNWRDTSGSFNKKTVESKILPVLNKNLGGNITYKEYLSRMKGFREKYNSYEELLKFSSGFGWNESTKMFTADEEIWDDYLESHKKHDWMKTQHCADYGDLSIVLGNKTASGKSSYDLHKDTTINNFEKDENTGTLVVRRTMADDFEFDPEGNLYLPDAYVPQTESPGSPQSPFRTADTNSNFSSEQTSSKKRTRTEADGNGSASSAINDQEEIMADELFNLRHASLRNVVERIFGVFKSRFTIFHSAPPFPYKTQAEIVLACAGLHNFLRKECRTDEFPVEYPLEPTPLPEHRLEDGELASQTQNRQRQEANEWRNDIAEKMWKDATGTNTNSGANTTNN